MPFESTDSRNPMEKPLRSVVVSNGFGQFHLSRLARGLHVRGMLSSMITGSYPHPSLMKLVGNQWVPKGRRLERFLQRDSDLPIEQVVSANLSESLQQLGRAMAFSGQVELAKRIEVAGFRNYQSRAARFLRSGTAGDIYHYRAGLGGESVRIARDQGRFALVDHSIAHPDYLENVLGAGSSYSGGIWDEIRDDINAADAILVNSEFVKESCIEAGIAPETIHVAYTGVEVDLFDRQRPVADAFTSVLFAGTVERRKGADTFLEASHLSQVPGSWLMVGDWMPDMSDWSSRIGNVAIRPRLARDELATLLSGRPIFVFPSRAEGSARVVAEAMTAGCYVVTTRQSGSVVRDGIDGAIVPADDPAAVARQVDAALLMSAESRMAKSDATSAFAGEYLSEERYISDVVEIYEKLVG